MSVGRPAQDQDLLHPWKEVHFERRPAGAARNYNFSVQVTVDDNQRVLAQIASTNHVVEVDRLKMDAPMRFLEKHRPVEGSLCFVDRSRVKELAVNRLIRVSTMVSVSVLVQEAGHVTKVIE